MSLDVRDERSVAACIDRARDAWGGLDVLVNNAGIGMRTVNPRFMSAPQPFWEVGPAGFRDVVETKVVGCFLMARAVVPMMLRDGRGRVVNISMNEQTMIRRGLVPYGPAGAAVEALSRVMAADLAGSSVTVNLLLPGGSGTRTGMLPDDVPAEVQARLQDPAVMGPPNRVARLRSGHRPARPAHRRDRVRSSDGCPLTAGQVRQHIPCAAGSFEKPYRTHKSLRRSILSIGYRTAFRPILCSASAWSTGWRDRVCRADRAGHSPSPTEPRQRF